MIVSNSALWHNKIYLISKKEFETGVWPISYNELIEDSRDLSKLLNVNKPKNLEKIENDQNNKYDYHYSERCKIGNIFDYLKINENENIKVLKINTSKNKIDEHFNAKSIFIKNQKDKSNTELLINKSLIFRWWNRQSSSNIKLIPSASNVVGRFLSTIHM